MQSWHRQDADSPLPSGNSSCHWQSTGCCRGPGSWGRAWQRGCHTSGPNSKHCRRPRNQDPAQEQTLTMLSEEKGVAGPIGDCGNLNGAVVVDHTVEITQDRSWHEVRVTEGEGSRIATVASKRLKPVAGWQGEYSRRSPPTSIRLKLQPGVTPEEAREDGIGIVSF